MAGGLIAQRLAGGSSAGCFSLLSSANVYRSRYRNRPKLAGLFLKHSPVLQVLSRDRPRWFRGKRGGTRLIGTQKSWQAFVTVAVRRPPLHLSCQDESLLVPTSWFLLWLFRLTCTLGQILTGAQLLHFQYLRLSYDSREPRQQDFL